MVGAKVLLLLPPIEHRALLPLARSVLGLTPSSEHGAPVPMFASPVRVSLGFSALPGLSPKRKGAKEEGSSELMESTIERARVVAPP